MKTDCAVIRDLLPLYQEGLASGASRQLIESHLPDCPACRAELAALSKKAPDSMAAALPIKAISRGIRRRRVLAIALAACLLLAFFTAFTAYLTDWRELPWKEGELTFERQGDQLIINILRPEAGLRITGMPMDPDRPGSLVYWATLTERRLDSLQARPDNPPYMVWSTNEKGDGIPRYIPNRMTLDLEPGENFVLYYSKTGEPIIPIYGASPSPAGGAMELPRLALAYYLTMATVLALAAALALLLGLPLLLFRNKPRARQVFQALLGLPIAYLGGHLLIKGFETTSYVSIARDFTWILVCAAFLYAAWLLYFAQRELRRPA